MREDRHNGWFNYETWAVNLWLTNEEASVRAWETAADEVWEESQDAHPKYLTASEHARQTLADRLRSDLEESMPKVDGLWLDLLNGAFSEVNWDEIASAMLDGKEGYTP